MKKLITQLILAYVRFFSQCALIVHRPIIIGITGSAGKTSARDAIFALLKDTRATHVIRKGNSESGIPLGILGLEVHSIGFDSIHKSLKDWLRLLVRAPFHIGFLKKYSYLIVEMGIDDPYPPKNMEYLLSIVQPDIAVVLNAYATHGAQFEKAVKGSITKQKITDAIASEKVKIATHNPRCARVIYNKDNEAIARLLDEASVEKLTFGIAPENDVSYRDYEVKADHTAFAFALQKNGVLRIKLNNYILPEVFREIVASALLVGIHLGMEPSTMKATLEKNFSVDAGRNTVLRGLHDTILIDSSYNASPESVQTMLELMKTLKVQLKRPFVFVFGDMRELGHATEDDHARIAEMLPGLAEYVYTVGPLTKKYVYPLLMGKRAFKDLQAFENAHEVGKYLKGNAPKHALILFKGSQNTIFLEEAVKFMLENGEDVTQLPRQEDYWMRKKHLTLR